jgi:hypothetical protein
MRRSAYRAAGAAAVLMAVVSMFAASAFGAPAITGFTPISGSVDDGGTVVTINGTGLVNTNAVYFNGIKAAWFQVGSDIQVFARLPAGATTGAITLTTTDAPSSTASSAGLTVVGTNGGNFTVFAPQFVASATNNSPVSTKTTTPVKKVTPKCKKGQKSTKAHPCHK